VSQLRKKMQEGDGFGSGRKRCNGVSVSSLYVSAWYKSAAFVIWGGHRVMRNYPNNLPPVLER